MQKKLYVRDLAHVCLLVQLQRDQGILMLKYTLFMLAVSCYLFSADYEIIVESSNPDACNVILNGLEEFNMGFFRQKYETLEVNLFVIYAKNDQSEIIGGLCGYIFEGANGSWAHVDYAWVNENRRNQGLGNQLFEEAEILARTKNCSHMQLFTFAYQAVDFYRKLGFECIGIIPKWIENYDAVFFRKTL